MRFAPPFIKDTLARMTEAGTKRVIAIILSPLQTEASWQRYEEAVRKAQAELGGLAPAVDYCPEWHAHPLFIEALAAQVARAFDPIKAENRARVHVVFTAHSIPESMSRVSPYVEQLQETTRLVAEKLHRGHWTIAFQSRSGNPAESWLEPDVRSVIRQLGARGVRTLVVVPVGFVCDHVEVLYDLDIEAKAVADRLGMRFFRASCVNDHPAFIRMMATIIEQSIKSAEDRGSENRR
jgi:ferrochelatase